MQRRNYFLIFYFLLLQICAFAQAPTFKEIVYVGTFSERGSKGLYVFGFDRSKGSLTELQTIANGKSPSFIAIHPNRKFLYVVYGKGTSPETQNGSVATYQIQAATGELNWLGEQPSGGKGPCHVSVDPMGRFAYVSNYGSGSLAVYPIQSDGKLGAAAEVVQHQGKGADSTRQEGPHMHSIIPSKDGKFIYASDLGLDKIMIYVVDAKTGKLYPASQPFVKSAPGAGPRHLTIHPNGNFACSAEELSSQVASYRVNKTTGALTELGRLSMLPADFKGKNYPADIHFSPDGKFLYASNRGHESLVIYSVNAQTGKLTWVGHEPTRGKHPRNFCVDEKGEYVMVANRDNDNVVIFKRDGTSGKLSYTGQEISVPLPVCVQPMLLK